MTAITSSRGSELQSLLSPSAHKGGARSYSRRPEACSPRFRPQVVHMAALISILMYYFGSPGGCRFLSLGPGVVMRPLQGG